MSESAQVRCIGILTAGGDCPGLNAAIRSLTRAATSRGIEVIGIRDGFRGLVENRAEPLRWSDVSGILTTGGTILGTSRDKPNKMPMGGVDRLDMTEAAVANYHKMHLDCIVCLGGGGTQRNALHLIREGGINVVTLPKTIDNDVAMTDISFGFYTALTTATEAIDKLHSTASSHHRIMVVEIMGHRAGWLALGAGVAGGADVILIPEIPYDPDAVAANLKERARRGKRFSIVAVAEGAISKTEAAARGAVAQPDKEPPAPMRSRLDRRNGGRWEDDDYVLATISQTVARQVEERTGLETRVTSLSHLQRGGTPSPVDRLLASQLGARAIQLIVEGRNGFMLAVRADDFVPVPLEEVASKRKTVPLDHRWVVTAREVGTCLGD